MAHGREAQVGRAGLVFTGGGARAAYQVGVLKAVRDLLPAPHRNPFPILCGTSAGAINAASIAVFADDFESGVRNLLGVWENIRTGHVYRSDLAGIARTTAKWLASMMLVARRSPISLLDNAPLAALLRRNLDFRRIQKNIERGVLSAVSITCSGYTSGQSVSFYQGSSGMAEWRRMQRVGCATVLRAEHLLASSALPFIFPAVRINREYFGDGSMRQIAPISPALHLGADRVLVIGAGRQNIEPQRENATAYPSLAQIAGHALNSIFLDTLNADIERAQRINRTVRLVSPERAREAGISLREIRILVLAPSQQISRMAIPYFDEMPRSIRFLLRGVGALSREGSNLASYLLFETGFCRALIELGYRDTMARGAEVLEFLCVEH